MFFYEREVHKLNFKRVFLYGKIKYEFCMYVTYEYSLDNILCIFNENEWLEFNFLYTVHIMII